MMMLRDLHPQVIVLFGSYILIRVLTTKFSFLCTDGSFKRQAVWRQNIKCHVQLGQTLWSVITVPVITVTKLLFILSNEIKMCLPMPYSQKNTIKTTSFGDLSKIIKMATYIKHWSNSLPFNLKGMVNFNYLSGIEERKTFPQRFPRVHSILGGLSQQLYCCMENCANFILCLKDENTWVRRNKKFHTTVQSYIFAFLISFFTQRHNVFA